MSDLTLACWFDMGDATCMLPDDHDGPHEPTPNNEIWVSLPPNETRRLRPDVTPVAHPTIGVVPALLLGVLSVPWWIGMWQIVQWILQ